MLNRFVVIELTWDESNGDANDQVDGQEDQLKYPQLNLPSQTSEARTLLTGRKMYRQ